MDLYLTEIPNVQGPGFMGSWKRKNFDGVWVMFPEEFHYEIRSLFPWMNSKFLGIYFGLLLIFSSLCIITFEMGKMTNFYYEFSGYLIGSPWGAFLSFLGLFLVFIFINPFGFQCIRIKGFFLVFLIIFFFGISVICLTFSVFDLTAADLLKSENLINTKSSYQFTYPTIPDTCDFKNYDCSVVWSANYTKKKSTCMDSYSVECISFPANDGSCSKGSQDLYNIFVAQGLFQFFLWVFWNALCILVIELYTKNRWPSVRMRMQEWSHQAHKNEIEMNINVPLRV